MDWFAGDMEALSFYTFTVDDLALRGCSSQNEGIHTCSGDVGQKPSPTDLARARVRNAVKISGGSTKFGPSCSAHDEDWEDKTQDLTQTLGAAAMIMIEDGENWQIVQKK